MGPETCHAGGTRPNLRTGCGAQHCCIEPLTVSETATTHHMQCGMLYCQPASELQLARGKRRSWCLHRSQVNTYYRQQLHPPYETDSGPAGSLNAIYASVQKQTSQLATRWPLATYSNKYTVFTCIQSSTQIAQHGSSADYFCRQLQRPTVTRSPIRALASHMCGNTVAVIDEFV